MTRRNKMLAAALGVLILLWQGPGIVNAIFIDPIRDRQIQIDTLQLSVAKKSESQRQLLQSASQLKIWSLRSLPPERSNAATYYHVWLIDLATQSDLKNVNVAPPVADVRPKENTYYPVKATVRAKGTFNALVNFLHKFHQSGLLHRVLGVKASSTNHEGNPDLDLTIDVEALSMPASPERNTLFAKTDKPPIPDKPLKARDEYAALAKKNPFVRGYNGPPPRVEKRPDREPPRKSDPPKDPPFDAAEHTYLISYFSSGETQEIWLYDRSSNERTILTEGSEFQIGDVKGRVVLIADDFVHILIDGEMWELGLGKNLREMSKVPKSRKPATK